MSRESNRATLGNTILDVLDSYIGTEGIYFEEVQDYPFLSPEIKNLYLEKARDEDCHTFLDSLDLIYDVSIKDEADKKKQLDFLRALKTINDICHNNEVYLGETYGIRRAVEHFFRNYHQPSDIPAIQARAKEIVSEHVERTEKTEAAVTPPIRTWDKISSAWRKELELPRDQEQTQKSTLNTARSNALPFMYPTISYNDSIRFLERFDNLIALNNFIYQWKALDAEQKRSWFQLANSYSEEPIDYVFPLLKKYHHFLTETQQKNTLLDNNGFLKTIEFYPINQQHIWEELVPHGLTNAHLNLLCASKFTRFTRLEDIMKYFILDQKKSIDTVVDALKNMDDISADYWREYDMKFYHPSQKEAVLTAILNSKNVGGTCLAISKNYDLIIKKVPQLIAKLDAYLASIPDANSTGSNLFRNRKRTDTKKEHIEALKKNIEGCILISDIEKAIKETIDKVDILEKGVSRRISSNKCGECLVECQAILRDAPGKTRTFC